jgi:hypothetical protein
MPPNGINPVQRQISGNLNTPTLKFLFIVVKMGS